MKSRNVFFFFSVLFLAQFFFFLCDHLSRRFGSQFWLIRRLVSYKKKNTNSSLWRSTAYWLNSSWLFERWKETEKKKRRSKKQLKKILNSFSRMKDLFVAWLCFVPLIQKKIKKKKMRNGQNHSSVIVVVRDCSFFLTLRCGHCD